MLDYVDLFQQITREEFEVACADLFQRVVRPLSQLFSSTGTKLSDVASVTLVGGGTRVPKIQALLKDFLGRELGQNLNTDEAPVFGAAFKAASLSKRFKVKEIQLLDVSPYPVNVSYEIPPVVHPGTELFFRCLLSRSTLIFFFPLAHSLGRQKSD